ncbi:MAG TPA: hypothetical protein VEJ41_03745, partial [Candidatus Acidoferrales bacterium]|nr:hypothetical protein [Candidatus Acidoferrales bacterium]
LEQRRGIATINLACDYVNSAAYQIALNDFDGARVSAIEGLRLAHQVQSQLGTSSALQHFALLAALNGQIQVSARLLGYVDAQFSALGIERHATEKWGYDKLMTALHEKLSEAEIERLAAEGAAWSEDQAVEEALKV